MRDWQKRAEILTDVVYFNYAPLEIQQACEEVFVWDLDKTYLDTRLGGIREFINTAFEKAFQKRNVPGTGTLVRALKDSASLHRPQSDEKHALALFFITASPPLLERRIAEKLRLDEIYPYGIFCKDNLKNLRPNRLWRLSQQVGYKIQALLQLRLRLTQNVRQIMWGDDSESDTIIYSLYSDICARRQERDELCRILRALRVTGKQLDVIMDLQADIPEHDPVEKIYINLAVDTDPEYYLKFGRRVVATSTTFQAALDLFQDGRLTDEQVIRVGNDMKMNYGFTSDELQLELDNLIRRQILGEESLEKLLPKLQEHRFISKDYVPSIQPAKIEQQDGEIVYQLEGVLEPWVPEHIDYLHDYR